MGLWQATSVWHIEFGHFVRFFHPFFLPRRYLQEKWVPLWMLVPLAWRCSFGRCADSSLVRWKSRSKFERTASWYCCICLLLKGLIESFKAEDMMIFLILVEDLRCFFLGGWFLGPHWFHPVEAEATNMEVPDQTVPFERFKVAWFRS